MGGTIVVKIIKPSKLNQVAIYDALVNAMILFGKDLLKEFKKTTKTWKRKPKFETLRDTGIAAGKMEIAVLTDDEIYGYLNDGTGKWGPSHKEYPIPKVFTPKSKRLKFQKSYSAKTSPGVIGSKSGGPSGPFVVRGQIMHPGIEPRKFDNVIHDYMQPRYKRKMEAAMKKAAAASGHGAK